MIWYFAGKAKWAQVHQPDKKYGNYELDLYMDDASFKAFKKSGLQLKVRESEDGKYVKFRRPKVSLIKGEARENGPPKVLDADGNPTDEEVGNGSEVTIKVDVYETAKGPAHRLMAVRVDNLVPYRKNEIAEDSIAPEGEAF